MFAGKVSNVRVQDLYYYLAQSSGGNLWPSCATASEEGEAPALIRHVTFSVRIYSSPPSGIHLPDAPLGGSLKEERKEEEERESPVLFHRRVINWPE